MEMMNALGTELALWLQAEAPWLTPIMLFFTTIGYVEGYILLLAALYWCIHPRLGMRIGLAVTLSAALNALLKQAFHAPRPIWVDARLPIFDAADGFGMPSNHAQTGAVFWGMIGAALQRPLVWVGVLFMIGMTGFSRVYLGAHFADQVLVGWLIGALLVIAFVRWEQPITSRMGQLSVARQIGVACLAALVLLGVGLVIVYSFRQWTAPSTWFIDGAAYGSAADEIGHLSLDEIVEGVGYFLGIAIGAVLIVHWGGFRARGVWWVRIVRYLVGLLLLAPVLLLGEVLEAQPLPGFWLLTEKFVATTLVSFWALGIVPILLHRLRLLERHW